MRESKNESKEGRTEEKKRVQKYGEIPLAS
jgi:hypothetical protein